MRYAFPALGLLLALPLGSSLAMEAVPISAPLLVTAPVGVNGQTLVTRGAFLQAVMSLKGEHMECRKAFPYSDVDWTAAYGDALQTASCMGIVHGNPDGTFAPDEPINYAAAAKILVESFAIPTSSHDAEDMSGMGMPVPWYRVYMGALARNEYAPRADIAPEDTVTYAEMRSMLNALAATLLPVEPIIEPIVDPLMPPVTMPDASSYPYLGLTVAEAQALAMSTDTPFRVVAQDGEFAAITMDYRPGRINATVEGDTIVSYQVEGSASEIMAVTVAPETMPCTGVGPMECLIVNGQYWYDAIAGFTFTPGYSYTLVIEKSPRPEPLPADVSAYTYTLLEEVSRTPMMVCDAAGMQYSSESMALEAGLTPEEFGATYCPDYALESLLPGTWMWEKTEYNDDTMVVPAMPEAFSITFMSDGSFSASTDCNAMMGQYTLGNDGSLTFGEAIAMTRKLCIQETQEQAFATMLEAVNHAMITDEGTLVLGLQLDTGAMTFTKQ